MKVLIIGGGGREHAFAWKVAQSVQVSKVFVAPGNAGTAGEHKTQNIAIAAEDVDGLLAFALEQAIDLTIVGPEAPLVLGLSDQFKAAGLACFGPSQAAAQLEGSKAFCKNFLQRHAIDTAQYATFNEIEPARAYVRERGTPIVIKADGLAAGKGVIIATDEAQAFAALDAILGDALFGAAGRQVVIEDYLLGEEVSFIAMVDGQNILALASSQDHKTRDEADKGPNTGGMGAYSPAPIIDDVLHARILREVIEPTVRGMAAEGRPYLGFLYAGLMISAQNELKVLEFNCRCGDPETQPIMMRLRADLVTLCQAALAGQLDQTQAEWDPRVALGVVMAAGGYPADYRKGEPITGLIAESANSKVFHAGTTTENDQIVTNGGRVLCVTALGDSVAQAQQQAYQQVANIHWHDVYYRRDIGYRAIARERNTD